MGTRSPTLHSSSPGPLARRAEVVADWRQRGYQDDPRPARLQAYGELGFDDIERFYAQSVKGKPVSIVVVGDPRKVDRKKLEAYGPVVDVSVRDILSR
mgnify:CR=1 FL=1